MVYQARSPWGDLVHLNDFRKYEILSMNSEKFDELGWPPPQSFDHLATQKILPLLRPCILKSKFEKKCIFLKRYD